MFWFGYGLWRRHDFRFRIGGGAAGDWSAARLLEKKTGVWNPYPLSSVIESIKDDGADIYVTASVGPPAEETIRQALIEWVLGIPAIVLLMAAAVMHFALYLYLARLEKGGRP